MKQYGLTEREIQILREISMGNTTKQIAQSLYLSDHTIISYRKLLFRKMDAMNAPSLVRRGFEMGYLSTSA